MSSKNETIYSERLWPSVGLFLALLLIIPALMVLMLPFQVSGGIFIGFGVYALVALLFLAASAKVSLTKDELVAGRGSIDRKFLGQATPLNKIEFRQEIGRKLDARAYLLLNGWVKTGVRIEITDPNDPTPYWIVASRNPEKLSSLIDTRAQT